MSPAPRSRRAARALPPQREDGAPRRTARRPREATPGARGPASPAAAAEPASIPPAGGPPRRVLHVASEGLPFSKTGGLADVLGGLPAALAGLGLDTAVVLPAAPAPLPGAPAARRTGRAFTVEMPAGSGEWLRFELLEADLPGVRAWLLDCPELFDRHGPYVDERGRDWPDNWARFAAFSRAAGDLAAAERFDVVHCHDWQAALVPVYEAARAERGAGPRRFGTVLTIHNLAYQGVFPGGLYGGLGLPGRWFHPEALEFYGQVSFLKGGILSADTLTTVSPTYAREILFPAGGAGLDGVLRRREARLAGILNGIDAAVWDPRTDPFIARRYHPQNLRGKKGCKLDLQDALGLTRDLEAPLAGVISRLVEQKGWDLLAEVLPGFVETGMQLAVLGAGEARFEDALRDFARAHPGRVGVRIGFDLALAHRIEAGADLFLMPSRFEPCGLNQMYSLRYGTIPVVRATGGLADTVVDASDPAAGTGFVFERYEPGALAGAIARALETFGTRRWTELQLRGMREDFSWARSAARYLELYRSLEAPVAGRAAALPSAGGR